MKKQTKKFSDTLDRRYQFAIDIGAKVHELVRNEVMATKDEFPFVLEDMALAYSIALANFSIYKVNENSPSWDKMKLKALASVQIAFDDFEKHLDDEMEDLH